MRFSKHLIPGAAKLLVPISLIVAGCVPLAREQGRNSAVIKRLADQAAEQIRRCYRKPKVSSEARQIITRLRVRFTPDGQLAALPELVSQQSVTPAAQPFAPAMAEAATLAIIRCAPIKLPPEEHANGWEELDFTFSPRAFG